eukprot:TRINITY_DN2843_c0_g1_i1.p1 TRINITY_DN2843_c0_g1~~TRINITY_DN2843_c0_g1_i1.p1  ORF type:complete len:161 (+),score=24.14 TRINITY_DN2843_c0_g1_i1:168-650(+)
MVPPLVNPVIAIPLAMLNAYVPHLIKGGMLFSTIGYDNIFPRRNVQRAMSMSTPTNEDKPALLDSETADFIDRCRGAHENGLEAFTYFGLAMTAALATRVSDKTTLSSVATMFLGTRVLYNVAYIFGDNDVIAGMRSLLFGMGVGQSFYLFKLARSAFNE